MSIALKDGAMRTDNIGLNHKMLFCISEANSGLHPINANDDNGRDIQVNMKSGMGRR